MLRLLRAQTARIRRAPNGGARKFANSGLARVVHRSPLVLTSSMEGTSIRDNWSQASASGPTEPDWSPMVSASRSTSSVSQERSALSATTSAVAPRVLCWYKPNSAFDMDAVAKTLEERNIPIDVCFPSSTPQHGGVGASKKLGSPNPHKSIEVLGFSIKGRAERESRTEEAEDAASPPPSTTYVIFADGSLVGWNATWEELVWMRNILQGQQRAAAEAEEASMLQRSDEASNQQHQQHPITMSAAGGLTSTTLLAVDSMRYQLFDSLDLNERPSEEELSLPDQQSYIDVDRDRIILEDDSVVTKLPFSYALVQSVKLEVLQARLQPVAMEVKEWQRFLANINEGGAWLSALALVRNVKRLRKAKSQLLTLVEALNFRYHTQTTPRIFWFGDFSSLRSLYRDACEHLEIEDRAHSLKAQLETLDETISYLHDEVHASANEWLTLIIIILIAVELVIGFGLHSWLLRHLYAMNAALFPAQVTPSAQHIVPQPEQPEQTESLAGQPPSKVI
mmetsp:Transcript_72980/g.84675  ORF Transcript_72980/g.84675 Transcript_72980/m.84675 type:complete len:509 (+) Transcript_72980:97-1623(+)